MRAVYLVRHGLPEKPQGERLCVGRLDLPLSDEGRAQARTLGEYFAALPVTVVSSPLDRCWSTAAAISDTYTVNVGLLELDMGEWTGLSFEEIRARWPELYEKRGCDVWSTAPPSGESLQQCARRVTRTFWEILEENPFGDLVLTAHSGVIRALVASLTVCETGGPDAPDCGSVTQLLVSGREVYAGSYGKMPDALPPAVPDEARCAGLWLRFGTPEHVRRHCRAVAELTREICRELNSRGAKLSTELACAGALLHDMARTKPRHERYAARALCDLGYSAVGAVVGSHMSLDGESAERWSESAAVFLADKLIEGERRVSLEERFFSKPDPRKLPFIQERYELARTLLCRLREGKVNEDGI